MKKQQDLNIQFKKLILKLQNLKKVHGDDYIIKCKPQIDIIGTNIKSNGLVDKCNNRTLAKQLLMMNDVPNKYWK